MAGTHSLWSPSGAKAWRSCLGYVVMNDGKEDTASKYSAEGTCYHGRSEAVIRGGGQVADFVGQVFEADGFEFKITEELSDYAQEYVDRIRERENAGCIVHVEVRADTSEVLGIPGQTGTIDARIFDIANETLEIRDLKFGAGVRVYVVEPDDGRPLWQRVNDQLGIYGLSEWQRTQYMCNWKWLKLVIDQPRIGGYSEVTLSREDVQLFAVHVHLDAQASLEVWETFKDDATGLATYLKPSAGACRWCSRAGSCNARTSYILELYKQMSAKNLPVMTGPELAAVLDKADEIEAFRRAARAEGLARAEAGSADAAPGWKIVEGRKGDRTANPADMERRAREAVQVHVGLGNAFHLPPELYTEPELKSVAQIQGACKKLGKVGKAIWNAITGDPENGVPSLITQAPGRNSLVRNFDERPELAPRTVDFELRPVGEEFSGAKDAAAGLL